MNGIERAAVRLADLRRNGASFDDAWPMALPPAEAWLEREAMTATRDAWRRAYTGQPPTPLERAAARVFAMLTNAPEESPGVPTVRRLG
jgi:hypothetical protein